MSNSTNRIPACLLVFGLITFFAKNHDVSTLHAEVITELTAQLRNLPPLASKQ